MSEKEKIEAKVEFEDWPELDRMDAMAARMSADRPFVDEPVPPCTTEKSAEKDE